MPQEALIEIENALVHRDGRRLVGPLSLAVYPGQFLGVVGPNGAGKSTLLRLLAGLEAPSSGFRTWPGLQPDRRARAPRGSIGFLLQHHTFQPDLPFCVEDVVAFGRIGLGRAGRRNDREAVEAALWAMGLFSMRRRLYRELSGGEKRKVHLARLIAQDAPVVLLDEPAAGLDLDWQERLTLLIAELHPRRSVVMVTHAIDRLPSCCTDALLLRDGRALAQGPPGEVFREDILSDLYGCAMEVVERRGRYHAISVGEVAS